MRKTIALLLCLLAGLPALAGYQFSHYDRNNGLSDNTVLSIVQDHLGFMWFGTKYGLNRFDGRSVKVYSRGAGGLNNDYINTLYVAPDNKMWVGTDAGVCLYSTATDSFEPFGQPTPNPSLKGQETMAITSNVHLIVGSGDLVYIATKGQGLFVYDLSKDELRHFELQGYPNITAMGFDEKNRTWLGFFGSGLYYTDNDFLSIQPYTDDSGREPFAHTTITGVVPAEQGMIYVGTDKMGLVELDTYGGDVRQIASPPTYANDNAGVKKTMFVHQLARYGNEILAATEDGVYIYEMLTHELQHYCYEPTNPFSISDNPIQSACYDREGGLWAGTYFGGVNYAPRQAFSFEKFIPRVDIANSLHGRRVRGFKEDGKGNIWIATEDGGLNRYDPQTKRFSFVSETAAYPNIHSLEIAEGKLWVGTFSYGLKIFDLETGRMVRQFEADNKEYSLRDNDIFVIRKVKNGDVYVGTLSGLFLYSQSNNGFLQIADVPPNLVYDIKEDARGNLWVAVFGVGLYRRGAAGNKWTCYSDDDERHHIASNNLVSIFESSKGEIWITTEGGGVCRYDSRKDTFEEVDIPSYQPRKVVYQIVEDKRGRFWMSTNNGLLCYNPEDKSCNVFTTANGQLENNFNYSASMYSSDGHIYMGSLEGFTVFMPETFVTTDSHQKIVATELLINNSIVDCSSASSPLKENIVTAKVLRLSHNQNSFALRVSNLNYGSLLSYHIAYKLEGFDEKWQDLYDDNYIKYTNLPSGTYTLRVHCLTSNDSIAGDEYTLKIVVAPSPLLTWWAKMIYLVAALLLAWAIFRYVKQRDIMQRKMAMEKFEHEKEQELYQNKISFFTQVAHEIRTPLTLIKGPLEDILHRHKESDEEKEDLSIMDQNVSRLLDLTNQLLDFRKVEQDGVRLNFQRCDINYIIESVFVRFTPLMRSKSIQSTLDMPDEDVYAFVDKEGFTKIVSNLINNAVKYCEKIIKVSLTSDNDDLLVTCLNDGPTVPAELREKIFTPFFRADATASEAQTGTGIGLALSHALTEQHGGTLKMLDDDQFNVFLLRLPLHQAETINIGFDNENDNENGNDNGNEEMDAGLPVALIVDDNQQMLRYQTRLLRQHYNVITATDGEAALKVLAENMVDIIVSDAMMEPMGGFALCEKLKNDVNYSHIPFILLTALTLNTAKVKGMECGADSYIEKPFSADYLMSVMQNLLRTRENIRKAYMSSPFAPLDTTTASKADEDFVARLQQVVSDNLANSDFDIAQLADLMFMSRTNLNRKIRGVFNLTPNNYIKIERLKRAAVLLKSGGSKVSEVCYVVGFSSPSYFSQCFYKQFGLLPKDFVANQ